jgi:hypothetical protein
LCAAELIVVLRAAALTCCRAEPRCGNPRWPDWPYWSQRLAAAAVHATCAAMQWHCLGADQPPLGRPCESRHGPRACPLAAGPAGHDGSAMDASKAFGGDPNAALRVTRRARLMEDETRVRRLRVGRLLGSPRRCFDVLARSVKGRVQRRSVSDMQQRTNRNHKDAASIRRVRAARSAKQRGETERLAHWKDGGGDG